MIFAAAAAAEQVAGQRWWLDAVEILGAATALGRSPKVTAPTVSEGTGPFTVILHDEGRRTLEVRRALRHFLGGDYSSIRSRVEQSPAVICRDCDANTAQRIADKLHHLGARTEIVPPAAAS